MQEMLGIEWKKFHYLRIHVCKKPNPKWLNPDDTIQIE